MSSLRAVRVECELCGETVALISAPPGTELQVRFECVLDGVSHLHPGVVCAADGAVLAEWPHGIGVGEPIVFDERGWSAMMVR